jgi:hypothetical protein
MIGTSGAASTVPAFPPKHFALNIPKGVFGDGET